MFLNVREKKKIKEWVGEYRDRLDTCVEDKNKKKEMKTYDENELKEKKNNIKIKILN